MPGASINIQQMSIHPGTLLCLHAGMAGGSHSALHVANSEEALLSHPQHCSARRLIAHVPHASGTALSAPVTPLKAAAAAAACCNKLSLLSNLQNSL
jgi:hypothetical protein